MLLLYIYIYIYIYTQGKKEMFKKKYTLYYTTNELKRRRTMTDGEGKSSFFALAESGIVLYFLIFSDLKYRVRRPLSRHNGLFLKAFL